MVKEEEKKWRRRRRRSEGVEGGYVGEGGIHCGNYFPRIVFKRSFSRLVSSFLKFLIF